MYTITNNGEALYDPRLQGLPVGSPKLTQEANTFDTLSFVLYPPHPAYDLLTKKTSILNVRRDNVLLAQFIPTYKRRVFNGGIEYKCKSIIALLDDYYYRTTEYSGSVSAFISDILSSYNARVAAGYRIQLGSIHSGTVEYKASTPKTCWKAIQTVTQDNGGYIAPRYQNGAIYLDYMTDADLPVSEQKIVFGENLTDLFIETDTDNCYSVLYPFGTDEDDNVVSIATVNSGLDYLENASAVAAYGRREKVMSWTNVKTPAQLLSLAQEQLSKIAALFSESVQLSAVDLHDAGVSVAALKFLTNIDCISAPHNYSHRYPITSIETVLDAPQSVSINLGPVPMTLTESFALEREKNAASRGGGGRAQAKAEKEFKRFETFYTQTDEKFSWLATDSEWDELSQTGHVTALTQLTRTAHFVEDTAKKELPFEDWKVQWLAAHPEDSTLTDQELRVKYNTWIEANPYAIYNNEYSDATRTERIISKTGINDLGQNETITSRVTQTADRLQSEISSTKSGVYSAVEQTLSGFRQVVSDDIAGYKSEIIQTQNTLRAEVANSLSDIYARILAWEGGGAIEVRNGNRTYKQFADPVTTLEHGSNDLMVGDIWVKSNDKRTWAEAGVDQWNTSNVYEWATYRGDDVYVWKDGRWQLTVSSKDLVIQGARLEVEQDEIWAAVDDTNNGLRAEMSLTASRFYQSMTDSVNGLSSTIEQTASQIRTEVHNANSTMYSSITQTASQIRSEVADSVNGLSSSITQTASQIRSEVSDTSNSLSSTIEQTASQIRSEVRNSVSGLQSSITQTASQIRSEVSDTTNNLQSSITQTASQIRSEVANSVSGLQSSITQTASQIRSEVSDTKNNLQSSITQTASQIRSEVSDTKNNLQSSITQTASQIRSEVSNTANNLRSSITQQENRIDLVVEGTGSNAKIKSASIAAAINAQTGQSTVNISADKVEIDGNTTLGSVLSINSGSAVFSRPVVFTGNSGNISINNTKISAKIYQVDTGGVLKFIGTGTGEYYDLSANTVKDFVTGVQVVADGNNYKLQKTTVYNSNWTDVGNFSRATTLSGAWSGSKYTVTASPQGNTKSIGFTQDSEVQLSLATNGDASEIPNGNRKMVSAPLRVYQTQGTTTTDRYTTSLTINAEPAWNHGWEDAAALTVAPTAGTDISFVFKAPKYYEKTQGNWVREQVSHTFTLSKGTPSASGGYASVTDSGSNVVAKIPLDDWYAAGQEAGGTVDPDDLKIIFYYTTDISQTTYDASVYPVDPTGSIEFQLGNASIGWSDPFEITFSSTGGGGDDPGGGGGGSESGGSSADQIDLYNFNWTGDTWNTGGSTRLNTLSSLILSHKNDRGYIYFDARNLDGSGTKRYYIAIG